MSKYYLCITPFFPSPRNWRGAYVLDQVKAIARNSNYELVVFTPCGLFENRNPYVVDGITVHSVPSWFMPSYFFNGFGGEINGRNIIKQIRRLNIDIEDIAVTHCHTAAFACFCSALKGINPNIRTVLQYHDLDPYQVRLGKLAGWWPNITYRFKKFVCHFKNIDLHLCISRRCEYNLKHFPQPHPLEYYEAYKSILKSASHLNTPTGMHTYVLYNGVDTSLFYKQMGLKNDGVFKIGCVSNFNELKGHMTLIRAVEKLVKEATQSHIVVSFIGSGETKASCMEYIKTHGLESYFVFEPEVSHDMLPAYYNTLDLFVLPSYFEGFGCVYTEAAACGVPFVGCYGQGYSEYIPDSNKDEWLIAPHDYEGLARIINRQIISPTHQALVYPYNIDVLIKSFLIYLKQL